MSGRKLDEKTVSIPEVKEIMEYVKEQMEEIDSEEGMSHFQEITYNYVNKFAKIDTKKAKEIKKFLIEKYDLEEIYAINIVNIDPQTVPELRIILEKSFTGKTLNDKQLEILIEELEEIKTS
ncbi:MAG: RNA polymerase Rpb4 [Candidatus Hodarchaeota archaeon]